MHLVHIHPSLVIHYVYHNCCIGAADKDSELCEADICSIDQAPSKMKAIRWLGCESCNKWYHGYCIKAKPSDYRRKTWLSKNCSTK